jgi:hypothetical protein
MIFNHGDLHGSGPNLIAEDGTRFRGDLNDYDCVRDELGRPAGGRPPEGKHVDVRLKKYLVSGEEIAQMREERLHSWEAKLLGKMAQEGEVRHPFFADGSISRVFAEWFLSRRGARPLHRSWDWYKKVFTLSRDQIFTHQGKVWIYKHSGDLVQTDLIYLRRVVEMA